MSDLPYRLIGCEVLRPEVEALLAAEPVTVEASWLAMGLHDEPEALNRTLRDEVAALDASRYRAVLLIFGLCSNGTLDITAPAVPLVIPKVHDCISLYLGSAARYQEEHEKEPGTYWFSRGFMHRKDRDEALGGLMGHAPGEEEYTPQRREALYQEYCEKYGEENAEYLMETWVDAWKRNYTRAVLFTWTYPEFEADRRRVQDLAQANGWRYEEMAVDLRLVRMLLAGDWPQAEFLVLQPGERIMATHDAHVLGCKACH